jgi:hypothetical protein
MQFKIAPCPSPRAQRLLQFGTQPLLLVDDDADEESRQGQNQYQHFQFPQDERGEAEQVRGQDDADLGQTDGQNGAGQALPGGCPGDGQEQQREVLELGQFAGDESERQDAAGGQQAERFPAKQQAASVRPRSSSSMTTARIRTPTTSPNQ